LICQICEKGSQTVRKRLQYKKLNIQSIIPLFQGRLAKLKIMSNELLVVTYRDALKSEKEKEWIKILKDEIKRRGLRPFKNR
jgi:hypothetical protein